MPVPVEILEKLEAAQVARDAAVAKDAEVVAKDEVVVAALAEKNVLVTESLELHKKAGEVAQVAFDSVKVYLGL